MNAIHIIGIGQGKQDLTHTHLKIIGNADLLIGGQRHLAMFPDFPGETRAIDKDIPGLIQFIQSQMDAKAIVILASGDPLFHGIGTTLARQIPRDRLVVHPNITSVAAAFAAICQPWHDARIISLHSRAGRDFLFSSLAGETKVAFLTGPEKGPGFIARQLSETGIDGFRVCVLENLGNPQKEKISWFTDYKKMADHPFAHPNIVILLRPDPGTVSHETYPGMPDDFFRHSKGMITKSEIRAISLSRLQFTRKDHLLWDIGSGSGSVGIEAAIQIPWGQVFAVEKNNSRIPDIVHNIKLFHQSNIKVVNLDFPQGHETLATPDRIFIGGGGKDLGDIIDCCCGRIREKGIIVINTVILESMETAMDVLKRHGFSPAMIQAQISRSKPMPFGTRLIPLNPVWIISGRKPSIKKA